MPSFLVCTHPITGHVNPTLEIVRALVERGHEVRVYTGRKFEAQVLAAGAGFEPMRAAYDYDDAELDTAFPRRSELKGLKQIKFDFVEAFINRAPEQVADLRKIFESWQPDAVLCDPAFAGARCLYELGEIEAFAVFNITVHGLASRDVPPFRIGVMPTYSRAGRLKNRALYLLTDKIVFRDVNASLASARAAFGLPKVQFSPMYSEMLYLQPTIPAFEFPRSDLIESAHFIGALIPRFNGEFVPPDWWHEVVDAKRPVVLVTQGTIATNTEELLAPTLRALADQDVLVIATGAGAETVPLPDNARGASFIPFNELMPHVSAMVTNGGYGGVTIALSNGVPLVCAGTTEDKPEVGNRVAFATVGINLKTSSPSPDEVRAAVVRVLGNPAYREQAQRLREEYAAHDGPTEAANLLERLVETKQPVLREVQDPWGRPGVTV